MTDRKLPLPFKTHIKVDGNRINIGYTKEELDKVRKYLASRRSKWTNRYLVKWEARVGVRKIRRMGEYSGEIIFGQKGLKLAKYATEREIRICIFDLKSRATHMRRHAKRLERWVP